MCEKQAELLTLFESRTGAHSISADYRESASRDLRQSMLDSSLSEVCTHIGNLDVSTYKLLVLILVCYVFTSCDVSVFEAFGLGPGNSCPINSSTLSALSTMSKRVSHSTLARTTKVKKRKGVGVRTIIVPDSDEEDTLPTDSEEYALVTKTRVGASGRAERVSMTSVPIFEVEQPDILAPLEENLGDSTEVAKNVDVVLKVPAKRRKRVNDSVS